MGDAGVSEKLVETLFHRFALQLLGFGGAWVHTPNTREEFVSGYDARLVGPDGFREVVLQFKRSVPSRGGRKYRVGITEHQHRRLQQLYPADTAYYLTLPLRDLAEAADRQCKAQKSDEFLRLYLAVAVGRLPADLKSIRYARGDGGRPCEPAAKSEGADRAVPLASRRTGAWMSGATLIDKFRRGSAGAQVLTRGSTSGKGDPTLRAEADGLNDEGWPPSQVLLEEAWDTKAIRRLASLRTRPPR